MSLDPANLPANIRAAMARKPALSQKWGDAPCRNSASTVDNTTSLGVAPVSNAAAESDPQAAANRWTAGEEAKLSALIVTALRRHGIAVVVARPDQKSTIAKGWPDLTCLFQGKGCCIEVKSGRHKLSKAQEECHEELRRAGVPVITAWNFDDAIRFAMLHLI